MPKTNFHLFQIIENWKLNWKLPKINLFVIWKIKNWIENCPKSIFIFLKLLKIEQKWNGRFRTRRINRSLFHETEIYFIQPKFICWIVVHFMKSKFIYSIEAYLLNQSLFCEIEIYLFNWNLFYEIKIYLFNQNLLFSIEVYLWNLC